VGTHQAKVVVFWRCLPEAETNLKRRGGWTTIKEKMGISRKNLV